MYWKRKGQGGIQLTHSVRLPLLLLPPIGQVPEELGRRHKEWNTGAGKGIQLQSTALPYIFITAREGTVQGEKNR